MRTAIVLNLTMCLFAAVAPAAARTVVPFDQDWRFHRGEVENGSSPDLDETAWAAVTLPHTWNVDVDPPQAGYYRGPGWYRKKFSTPANWRSQRVYVRFGAAS